jgi:hypothetical protein
LKRAAFDVYFANGKAREVASILVFGNTWIADAFTSTIGAEKRGPNGHG